jgi:hypothetical protein
MAVALPSLTCSKIGKRKILLLQLPVMDWKLLIFQNLKIAIALEMRNINGYSHLIIFSGNLFRENSQSRIFKIKKLKIKTIKKNQRISGIISLGKSFSLS